MSNSHDGVVCFADTSTLMFRKTATAVYASRRMLRHGVFALAAFGLPFSAYAAEQWEAVPQSPQEGKVVPVGTTGDKLYMMRQGDTLEAIAKQHTGNVDNWKQIARYNKVKTSSEALENGLIFIPKSLLDSLNKPAKEKFEIQEFDEPRSQQSAGTKNVKAEKENKQNAREVFDVVSKNIDMFAGEVQVLAKVSVKRVAVGNGAIIRAQVLKSGELLVIAQEAGSSSLRLWHKDGSQTDFNIRVSETDNETRFPMERMVRMKVKMVEFRKSALGKLGIDWGDSIAGPTFATAGDVIGNNLFRPVTEGFEGLPNNVAPFSTYFGIASNITSRINFLATNGDAVTLAEPVLSCTNGGSASFLAGGEVPYPSIGINGQPNIEFKEYGIKLNIAPQIDPQGNVRTTIDTEISQLDPAVSINGTPGLLTRRAQTQVNVRSGQTIVISGLLTSESSNDIDKLPGLGNLPILGHLFKSKNIRNSVTELVIFVTPEIIEPQNISLNEREADIFERSAGRLERSRNSVPLLD